MLSKARLRQNKDTLQVKRKKTGIGASLKQYFRFELMDVQKLKIFKQLVTQKRLISQCKVSVGKTAETYSNSSNALIRISLFVLLINIKPNRKEVC